MTDPATEIYYVYAAYAAAIVIVAGITAWTLLGARSMTAALAELEARGIRRRSAPPSQS